MELILLRFAFLDAFHPDRSLQMFQKSQPRKNFYWTLRSISSLFRKCYGSSIACTRPCRLHHEWYRNKLDFEKTKLIAEIIFHQRKS